MERSNDRFLQRYLKSKIKEQNHIINELRTELHEIQFANLRMRLDIQVLSESPNSTTAERIRHRHNIRKVLALITEKSQN